MVFVWRMLVKMQVSKESSGRNTSDFSIERILSEEPRDRRQEPSWLCCTRYRPPRLQRPTLQPSSSRCRRSGRHARVPFTAAQASALEAAYSRAPYLAPPALRALAAALQLRDDRIKIWFQNRRARERREKCITITPPQAITLPSTRLPQTTQNINTNQEGIAYNTSEEINYLQNTDTYDSDETVDVET